MMRAHLSPGLATHLLTFALTAGLAACSARASVRTSTHATPATASTTATTPTPATTPTASAPVSSRPVTKPPVVTMPWDSAGIAWATPPNPAADRPFVSPVPKEFTLSNGVRVLYFANPRLPLVSLRIVAHRAGAAEDGAKPGLAALSADLLDEAAGSYGVDALAEAIEGVGAELEVSAGADSSVLAIEALAETLPETLALAADVFIRPSLAEADFARVKADALAAIAQQVDRPGQVAAMIFDRVIYGDHPYGAPVSGSASSVEAITLADVRTFVRTHYHPKATTLVVAGDVTAARLLELLAPTFGSWRGDTLAALPKVAKPKPRAPALYFFDRPGAPQSVVRVGRLGPAANDRERFIGDVVNNALGGSFTSRLNARLREELGYTYGAGSLFWRGKLGGVWRISTALRTDVTVAGLQEMLRLVEQTRTQPIPAPELAKNKQLMTRSLPQDFETNASIVATTQGLIATGAGPRALVGAWQKLAAVTAAQAQKLARRAWERPSIVVVGDWAVLGDKLSVLGLPVVRVDANGAPLPAP